MIECKRCRRSEVEEARRPAWVAITVIQVRGSGRWPWGSGSQQGVNLPWGIFGNPWRHLVATVGN